MKTVSAIVAIGLAGVLAGCGPTYSAYGPRYAYAPSYVYAYTPAPAYVSSGYYYNPSPYERPSDYTGSDPWWHTRNYRGIHAYPEQ
jgi:hypothetical protein